MSGATGLRERKKVRTRQGIVAAAHDLFLSKSYEETTMEEIAERAEQAVGTLYNYFNSKEALFAELVSRARGELLTTLDEAVQAYNGWARLQATARFMLGFAHRNARMLAVYQDAIGGDEHPAADPAKQEGEQAIVSRYEACLESLAAQGELRADLPIELMAKTMAYLGLSNR